MKPGQVVDVYGEDGTGVGIVMATSRHRHSIPIGKARDLLHAEAVLSIIGRCDDDPERFKLYRPAVDEAAPERWYSVTKRELDENYHDACASDQEHTPGDWCGGGTGKAWVDVLSVSNSRIYELDEPMSKERSDG